MSNKQLFLDSANLDDIKRALSLNLVSGVTTNPSLMAKEQKPEGLNTDDDKFEYYVSKLEEVSKTIESLVEKKAHLSVEVLSLMPEKMVKQAKILTSRCKNDKVDLYIKIPFVLGSIPCLNELKTSQIKVNLTALMTSRQGYMSQKYSPEAISFFFNRMIDGNIEEYNEIKQRSVTDWHQEESDKLAAVSARVYAKREITNYLQRYRNNPYRAPSFVIAGSIRTTQDVEDLWWCGVDAVTAPMHVVEDMMHSKKTYEAVQKFSKDIEEWLK